MSATVTLHPSAISRIPDDDRDIVLLIWSLDMRRRGFKTNRIRLARGELALISRPMAHTNINRIKRPRYAGQFGKARPDDLPPHAA